MLAYSSLSEEGGLFRKPGSHLAVLINCLVSSPRYGLKIQLFMLTTSGEIITNTYVDRQLIGAYQVHKEVGVLIAVWGLLSWM